MTAMKICKRCGTEKLLEQFSRHKKCKDGYQGTCLDCTALTTAKWALTHPERRAETNRNFEGRHPQRKAIARYLKKSVNPEKLTRLERDKNLYARYGITVEDYAYMFYNQKGNCKICGRSHSQFARGLVVDHNHISGKIRGLLCDPCNRAIGYFRDNVKTLSSAIEYINQDPVE